MYSHQQTFDMACEGLRKLDHNKRIMCLYRHYNGNKCIIGVLFPDEKWSTEMEGYGIDRIMELKFKLPSLSDHNLKFLVKLQHVHDHSTDYKDLDDKLREYAKTEDLIYRSILDA